MGGPSVTIASRREAITREQHMTQITIEREVQYWSKMGDRHGQMAKRMIAAAKTCDDLYIYLNECRRVVAQTSSALMSLPSFGKDENGTIRSAAIAQGTYLESPLCGITATHHVSLIDLLRKASTQYISVEERIFNDTCTQATNLARQANKKSTAFIAAGAKVHRDLKAERQAVNERWMAYDAAVNDRQKALLLDKPGTSVSSLFYSLLVGAMMAALYCNSSC